MSATQLQGSVSWQADPEVLSRPGRPWDIAVNIAVLAFSAIGNTVFSK